jgi:hypothetical protein
MLLGKQKVKIALGECYMETLEKSNELPHN